MKIAYKITELSISNHPKLTHIDDLKIFYNLETLIATNNSISIPNL